MPMAAASFPVAANSSVLAAALKAWRDAYKDAPEKMIKKMESRGFGYARNAYAEMQKIKAEAP